MVRTGVTLGGVPGVVGVTLLDGDDREEEEGPHDRSWRLECERGADPREGVFRAAVEKGWVLLELAREQGATMEDIFVRLTTHDTAAAEPRESEAAEAPDEKNEKQEVAS